jgi:hypothetical protein
MMVAIYQATAPTRCEALILFYLMCGTITVLGTGGKIYDLSTICWAGNGNEVRDMIGHGIFTGPYIIGCTNVISIVDIRKSV